MSGIIGIGSNLEGKIDVADSIYNSLVYMDDLGEDSCGVLLARNKEIKSLKGLGTCEHAIKPMMDVISNSDWEIGIGQDRKAWEKKPKIENAGPLEIHRAKKSNYKVAISFDGIILKHELLRAILEGEFRFESSTDAEVVGAFYHKYLEKTNDLWEAGARLEEILEGKGYYSAVMVVNEGKKNKLVAIRSHTGTTPLCIGEKDNIFFIASESNGLDANYVEFSRFVEPGEMVVVSENGIEKPKQIIHKPNPMLCIFEGIYFGSPEHFMLKKGEDIFLLRRRLGHHLGERLYSDLGVDCVTYIPDTGKGVGKGYSERRNLDFVDALKKNRHIRKTYNISDREERLREVSRKTNPIRSNIKDKKLAVGEDSIVKGTVTMGGAIGDLKYGGAEECHLMISYAPIFFPCPLEFYRFQGLAAWGMWNESLDRINKLVAEKIGCGERDSVNYNNLEGLISVFGGDGLCRACVDGRYPVVEGMLPEFLRYELERFHSADVVPSYGDFDVR